MERIWQWYGILYNIMVPKMSERIHCSFTLNCLALACFRCLFFGRVLYRKLGHVVNMQTSLNQRLAASVLCFVYYWPVYYFVLMHTHIELYSTLLLECCSKKTFSVSSVICMSRPVFVEARGETSQSGVISSPGTWPPGSPPIPFGQSLNFRQRKDILETFMAPQMRLVDLHSWHFYIVRTISQCPQFHNIKMSHCPEPNLCVREKLCPLTTAICFARSTLNIFLIHVETLNIF